MNKEKRTKVFEYLFLIGIVSVFFVTQNVQAGLLGGEKMGPASFADLAAKVKHSVVNISTTQIVNETPFQGFFGPNNPFGQFFGDNFFKNFFGNMPQTKMKMYALGSGFVISEDGLILTNNHVVQRATKITVILESGQKYKARVLGQDPRTDLALIKVKPDGDFPKPVKLGDSDSIRVGDWVMAVGNPFGLGQTITTGIISAKGRIIGAGPYDDFLQTDAAINPGNSGGPLFNMKGQVIGINTAIIAHGQGIGFAIPINMAKQLLPELKTGKIVRGWLGVMIQDLTPDLAKSFGLKKASGVLIADVLEGGPAQKAGLKRGDIITRFNGKVTNSAHALSRLVAVTQPKTTATVDIIRNGKPRTVQVIIGTMPQKAQSPMMRKAGILGLVVQNITPELSQRFGLNPGERGVVISSVEPGSLAAEAGLRPGDVIKDVNHQEVNSVNEYMKIVQKTTKNKGLLLLVKRGTRTFFVVLRALS